MISVSQILVKLVIGVTPILFTLCSSMEVEKKLSKKLTEKEKAIIINTIRLSCTEAEIAKKMGTSQQAVHKGKKKALEKLRNKIYSNFPVDSQHRNAENQVLDWKNIVDNIENIIFIDMKLKV